MKMTVEDRDAWTRALRSGYHRQGRSALCSEWCGEVEFCSLGLLEDVLGTPHRHLPRSPYRSYGKNGDTSTIHLTQKTRERLSAEPEGFSVPAEGIPESCQKDRPNLEVSVSLSRINDRGATFLEIADLVEKYIEIVPEYSTVTGESA